MRPETYARGAYGALSRHGGVLAKYLPLAAWLGLAFWVYCAFLRKVAGPLVPDEMYFAHHFWLLDHGRRQYLDFNSNHLPAYFTLLKPLVTGTTQAAGDLSFVFRLRAFSAIVIAGYVALAWSLARRVVPQFGRAGAAGLAGLLLVFVVFARMVEIRTDTLGLLLVNCAWAVVLSGRTTRRLAAAAVLAGLALLFSARAPAMVGVMGLLLLFLPARSGNRGGVRALLVVAGAFLLAGLATWLVAPEWTAMVLRACFMQPVRIVGGMPLADRFIGLDRTPLSLMILAGALAGMALWRRGDKERGLVVAVACWAQLLMIAFDPSAYEYVFGWAAVPVAVGIASVGRALVACLPFALGSALVAMALAQQVVKGQPAPSSSPYRLTFDAAVREEDLARLPVPALVGLMMGENRENNLVSHLRVRSEVCRRLSGTAVTVFDANPICMDDATYHWTGVTWPSFVFGEPPPRNAMTMEEFQHIFDEPRPRLFVWRHGWDPARLLRPEVRKMLACCYDIHEAEGFAVLRQAPASR